MHARHNRHRGWNPFWAALGAALLVLVPLVGGTVLLSRQQLSRQLRQAARSQQGVAVQLPRESDRLTVLVCTAGEQPGFVLAYLNASQNCVHLLAVPAGLQVTFADEAAARGAVWDAFFRQNLDLLPGALPQALRSVSASLLTDLTALDLDTLDRTLEFLANNEAQIETQVLPGDEQAGRYTLNEESLAAVQSFFNVSPTDGQASSASEP